MGGELWMLQGCGCQCLCSFLGNHLDVMNSNVGDKSYDFGMQQDGRHF
jgi:hypothetical protein